MASQRTVERRACGACGQQIPSSRLAAVPTTRWCVRCAETRVGRIGAIMHTTAEGDPAGMTFRPLNTIRSDQGARLDVVDE